MESKGLGDKAMQAIGSIGKFATGLASSSVDTGNTYGNSGLIGGANAAFNSMRQGNSVEEIAEDTAKGGLMGAARSVISQPLVNALGAYGSALSGMLFTGAEGLYNGRSANQIGANITGSAVGTAASMMGGAILGAPGMIAAGVLAGPVISDSVNNGLIGDAFDSRYEEPMRDSLEDTYGYSQGKDVYEQINTIQADAPRLAAAEQYLDGRYNFAEKPPASAALGDKFSYERASKKLGGDLFSFGGASKALGGESLGDKAFSGMTDGGRLGGDSDGDGTSGSSGSDTDQSGNSGYGR
jgi:hypothetical protein